MSTIARQIKKPWVVMPLVALLALGGWFVFKPDDSASAGQSAAANDQVVQATVGTMAKTVSADGTVAAASTQDLNFGSSGTVTAVNVKAGDEVKKGQVLAEIDSAALQASVSSAESSLADAQAKLSDDEDASASDAQIEADQSTVTSAQDQLDAANVALTAAKLTATADGTVASVNVTKGEELASGGTGASKGTGSGSGTGNSSSSLPTSTGSGSGSGNGSSATGTGSDSTSSTADISIISTGKFSVDLGFDATEIGNLKVGQTATVTISTSTSSSNRGGGFGFPGGFFPGAQTANKQAADGAQTTATTTPVTTSTSGGVTGVVTEVGKVADASSGVASYPVTVVFADTTGAFNVGANVTAAITYSQVADAIQVPAFAVSTASDGTSTLKVKTAGGTETRTVTTGLTSGNLVQITSGLKAGESVVITFPSRPSFTGTGTGSRTSGSGGPSVQTGGGS